VVLIQSPRHTREDLRVWHERDRRDEQLLALRRPAINAAATIARDRIVRFAESGPAYLGVSWGKDSVVIAHLLSTIEAPSIVPVYFVHAPRDNPDCALVRDAFLARHALSGYREQLVDARVAGDTTSKAARYARWIREGGLPERRITGVRAAESKVRELSMWTHGDTTESTCRPIIEWSTIDVFLYLRLHDLPVHPAYACSFGGTIDRDWLRVAPLGGSEGTGHGRAEWERRYYPADLGLRFMR
jgi:phosphoadenosine phosphosulfate reductase